MTSPANTTPSACACTTDGVCVHCLATKGDDKAVDEWRERYRNRGGASAQPREPLTHVACRDTEGRVWSMPAPFRHHHVLRVMHDHGAKHAEGNHINQGFLDATGRYLNRLQARVSAAANGQIKNGDIIGGVLTSEDLW